MRLLSFAKHLKSESHQVDPFIHNQLVINFPGLNQGRQLFWIDLNLLRDGWGPIEPIIGVKEVSFSSMDDAVEVGRFLKVLKRLKLIMRTIEIAKVDLNRGVEAWIVVAYWRFGLCHAGNVRLERNESWLCGF